MVAVLAAASLTAACVDAPRVATPPQASEPSTSQKPPGAWSGTGPRYVAMGDSAAAAPLVPDQALPVGCLRSTNDYPSVLARRIGAASSTDVTCSGARTEDLASRTQSTRTGQVPPQLDAVTANTQLVTVTVGGNDVDSPAIAAECRQTTLDVQPCLPDLVVVGVDGISQAIEADADDWSALIADIRDKAPAAR